MGAISRPINFPDVFRKGRNRKLSLPPIPRFNKLSRRERQIMDILYRDGRATVASVLAQMSDPPSYSAVRALLRILEEKGHITHTQEGHHFLFEPVSSRQSVAHSMLQQVVQTFFGGSVENAVTTLLSSREVRLSEEEIGRLQHVIDQAKAETEDSAETDGNEPQIDPEGPEGQE